MSINVGMVSLGCPKNQVDGEILLNLIQQDPEFALQGDPEQCDVVLINTCGFIDDAKQRDKMTEEFYLAVKKEIAEYQERADYLIQSNSPSPAIMERWVLKIETLEQKKRHYEEILRRELDGLDDEFASLKFLSQELSLRARNLRFRKAA